MRNFVPLSVIILTKNRARLLEKCLTSLKGQLFISDEIILVNNNSTDDTQEVIRKYQRVLPIHAYKTSLIGYPNLYNFAISKSKKDLMVFLDDDCIATPLFISQIRERFKEKRDFVLQGKTLSLPLKNIYAEISENHLTNWMNSNIVGKNKLRVIDNRNVIIPKVILQKVGGFSPNMKLGSEDVELGIRLVRLGIPIVYDPLLVVYHHERTKLKEFLIQHYRIAKSHAVLDYILSEEEKISIVNRRTWARNLHGAIKLWNYYWRKRRYNDVFLLPFIYSLLVIVRINGYSHGRMD